MVRETFGAAPPSAAVKIYRPNRIGHSRADRPTEENILSRRALCTGMYIRARLELTDSALR